VCVTARHVSMSFMAIFGMFVFLYRPFSTVDGQGFINVAQKLISIGHKYGNIQAEDILPCSTTVDHHMESVVAKQKAELCLILKSAVRLGLTTDLWTSDKTTVSFITVTLHFIDNAWKMCAVVLATRPAEDKHTAVNVKKLVHDILKEHDLHDSEIVYVTDNAANMKAAFKDELWIGCAGHNMNLVLTHGLQLRNTADSESCGCPSEVQDVIPTCKEIVTLAKRTRVNKQLESTLKQCVSSIDHSHWPPNSPDLNPVDYSVWSVLQEKVYRSKIADIDELKTRLVNEWAQFNQSITDAAISQWRRRLSACVRACGAHFEHKC